MTEQVQKRPELPRRCAWCERFHVNNEWILGRRTEDEAFIAATSHTICADCLDDLREAGLSI